MNKGIKEIGAIFFLGILLLIYFWPTLTGGTFISSGMILSDLMLFNYPLKAWYKYVLETHQMPFWTTLVGNGYPIFAEGQVGALYPFHFLLFRFLPTLLAFNLNLFLHFFMAAIFTFLFCRSSLKLSYPASILAGLVYSFSGFYISHLPQVNIVLVISYLPLVLLLIDKMVKTEKWYWVFILAFILAFQILAGHIEMFYYTSLLGFLYFIVIAFFFPAKKGGSGKKLLALFLLAFVLGVGMTFAQILPTWELTKFSQRAEGIAIEQAAATLWPLKSLILFINPRAYDEYVPEVKYHPSVETTISVPALYGYVGILPLLLALLAIAFYRKRFVFIFAIFLFAAFLFGQGRSTQIFAIFFEIIPGMKFFRHPVKILFFIEFCLAILAAFGFDYLFNFLVGKKEDLKRFLPILSGILIVIVFIDLYFNNALAVQEIIPGQFWLEPPVVVSFLKERAGGSLFRFYTHGTNNLDYTMAREYQMQKEFQNLLNIDFNMVYNMPANREWFVLFLDRQTKLNAQKTSLDTQNAILGLPEEFKKSISLQNVRFLLTDLPIEDKDLVLVDKIPFSRQMGHFAYLMGPEGPKTITIPAYATYIYENEKVYPRVSFAAKAKIIKDENQVLEAVLSPDFDPTKEVILEKEVLVESQNLTRGQAKIDIKNYQENRAEIELETENSGFLVLGDTFYPGWQARVDGEEAEIYRANYAFRAVPISSGKHRVEFIFEPTHWRLGLGVSVGALVITLGGLLYCLMRRV